MQNKKNNHFQVIELLDKELKKPLPGINAQLKMMPVTRQGKIVEVPGNAKNGAVLILLYMKEKKLSLCLIKRTNDGGAHSGQISLPGGKKEDSDMNLIDTAIRETKEELGISLSKVKLLGILTSLYIPVSNYNVLPVIAYSDSISPFKPNTSEVEEVLEVSVDQILIPVNCKIDKIINKDKVYEVPVYTIGKHKIWGATAMILSEFVTVYRNALAAKDSYDYLTGDSEVSEL